MSSAINNPSIPYIGSLPQPLEPGHIIRIHGTVKYSATCFSINLQGSSLPRHDIALHLSPVFTPPPRLVRNSIQNQQWGPEESHGPTFPFSSGENFEIIILAESSEYKIAINGQHFTEFSHRSPLHLVTHLAIDGDVTINTIKIESSLGSPQHGRSDMTMPIGFMNPSATAPEFHGPPRPSSPYGAPSLPYPTGDAAVGPQPSSNPYGSSSSNPYGPPGGNNPYGPYPGSNPYGPPTSNPYGGSSPSHPYGPPPSSSYGGSSPSHPYGPPPGGAYPSQPGGYPGPTAGYPLQPAGYPSQPAGYPSQPAGYPSQPAGYPSQPAGYPGQTAGYPGQTGGYGYPSTPGQYPGGTSVVYPGQEKDKSSGGLAGLTAIGSALAGGIGGAMMGKSGKHGKHGHSLNPASALMGGGPASMLAGGLMGSMGSKSKGHKSGGGTIGGIPIGGAVAGGAAALAGAYMLSKSPIGKAMKPKKMKKLYKHKHKLKHGFGGFYSSSSSSSSEEE